MGSEASTMQVLKVLSDIWKSGAEMNLDTDGQIELKNHQLVPVETMKDAERIFPEIEKWFKSYSTETKENVILMKVISQFCGWQMNSKLEQWLCAEDDSLDLFNEWMIVLTRNGWIDIYSDFRQFENEESINMGKELYKRAVLYTRQNN